MTPFDHAISWLQADMETPASYGLFHIVACILTLLAATFLVWRVFFGSLVPFCVLSAVAMGLNMAVPAILNAQGITDFTFNMFFISHRFPCTLPVLSGIYPVVPYPVFLLLYLVGFAAVAAIIFAAEKGTVALTQRCRADR